MLGIVVRYDQLNMLNCATAEQIARHLLMIERAVKRAHAAQTSRFWRRPWSLTSTKLDVSAHDFGNNVADIQKAEATLLQTGTSRPTRSDETRTR